ncbi:MAG: hypothetical protein QOH51_3754 [Acidobacteriota bacterium]|jgi:hypothetical protein|nr:hypothetical protein [Acidobacteriota bacterium]
MKQLLRATLRSLFALAFVSTSLMVFAHAEGRDDRVITDARVVSAHAGGINFVSGDVRVRRTGETEWRALSAKDELKSGDAVRTGADGRVEMLLNPGSYFRAGEGAEFALADASLDDLRVALTRGSAIVEATGYGDLDLSITIATPQTRVRIIRSGVYRINVLPTGAADFVILKGRALVGPGETILVKGGRVAHDGEGGVELAKLDKKERDSLDLWSRERGKELAKANERLSRRAMTSMFARTRLDDIFGEPGRHGYAGVWLWSQGSSCYTFLPFYPYWSSPYGFDYWQRASYFSGFNTACQCNQVYTPPGISRSGETYNPPSPTWTPSPSGSPGIVTNPPPGVSVSDGSSAQQTIREAPQPVTRGENAPGPRDRP